MSRPADWSALELGEDPVIGDPDQVRDEARYYGEVADRISDQVRRLRRISDQDGLEGEYSEELRSSCEDLADHLDKAHDRFDVTSQQLYRAISPLQDALAETEAALADAKAAKEEQQAEADAAETPPVVGMGGMVDSPDMTAARNRLWNAMDAWGEKAKSIAGEIRDGADDDMKDGRFESIKAWVKDHADLLRKISEILGAIVLVLALVIFIVSNPAGWVIGLALLAGTLLLAVDVLLAMSGEGSWADVALDVFGIATLGMGSVAGKLARFGRTLSISKGTNMAGLRGFASSLRATFNGSGPLGRVFSGLRPSTWTRAFRGGSQAADDVASRLAGLTVPNAFKSGQLADDLADIARIISPSTPAALHGGAVNVAGLMSRMGDGGAVLSFITHSWIDAGHLGSGIDGLTTREIQTQTW